MLQQILKDMWVDPDILAELDETQKQTLFCKMREEQVRKWRLWDEKSDKEVDTQKKKAKTKSVSFLLDENNEPWTWVMGEHSNDKTIEEILEEEAREKARKQAEFETEQLRKTVEKTLTEYIVDTIEAQSLPTIPQVTEPIQEDYKESYDIYCDVNELRDKINKQNSVIKQNGNAGIKTTPSPLKNFTFDCYKPKLISNNFVNNYNSLNSYYLTSDDKDDNEVLNDFVTLNKTAKVSHKIAMWEKRVMEERTSQIFKRIQREKLAVEKEAEELDKIQEELWKEQERKAKEAEQKIREIARKAREEHRRMTNSNSDLNEGYSNLSNNSHQRSARPLNRNSIVQWYSQEELPRKAGCDINGEIKSWFYGLIDRQEAERLLTEEKEGTFLVRVSERIWGYAISLKCIDRCKHYLVDASSKSHYQFLGANQKSYDTLNDLVEYHSNQPITAIGGEKLLYACTKNKHTIDNEILNVRKK